MITSVKPTGCINELFVAYFSSKVLLVLKKETLKFSNE